MKDSGHKHKDMGKGAAVDVDRNSGFCAGVIRAVNIAEEKLGQESGRKTFSLGAIVHNEAVLSSLESAGLVTIDREDLDEMQPVENADLIIRAHGEPPSTYARAEALGFGIVDCTCPVVLKLQKRIREAYLRQQKAGKGQIVIFGKVGHAEVLGLVGQTDGTAVVVENMQMLEQAIADGVIKPGIPTEIFSQTTKSPGEYGKVCARLAKVRGLRLRLKAHDTICRQVATRHEKLSAFARSHDVIVFVCGKSSSNGKVLCEFCKSVNIRTYHVSSVEELNGEWFREDDRIGVCGAASTPKWLLEETAAKIRDILQKDNKMLPLRGESGDLNNLESKI